MTSSHRRPLRLPGYAAPLFVALLGLGFALVPLLRGQLFFYWDNAQQHFPQTDFLHRALRSGHLPQWWPDVGLGFPTVAEGQAAHFHPFRVLLAWLFEAPTAVMLEIGTYLAVAGVGTYYYLRSLRLQPAACVTGAIGQMFGSFSVVFLRNMALHRSICLFPVAMLFAERTARDPKPRNALGFSLVVALQLLSGHPTFMIVTGVATTSYLLLRLIQRAWAGRGKAGGSAATFIRPLALWALAAAIGFGIGAVQVAPTLMNVAHSIRSNGFAFSYATRALSADPGFLPELLFPYAYRQGDWLPAPNRFGSVYNLGPSAAVYVGALPVVAAFVALLTIRRRRPDRTLALVACALIATAFAMGSRTPLFPALWLMPGMNGMRYPGRFLMWTGFSISCLGAVGVHRLLALCRLRAKPRINKGAWLVFAGAILALAAGLWVRRPDFQGGTLASLVMLGLATGLAAATAFAPSRLRPVVASALIIFALGDLLVLRHIGNYGRLLPRADALTPPSAAMALRSDTTRFRVMSLVSMESGLNRPEDLRAYLQADLSSMWGIASSDAWFSLLQRRHYIVREGLVYELLNAPATAPRLAAFLAAMDIKYVLAPDSIELIGWTRFHQSDGVTTWRNPEPVSAARLVWHVVPEPAGTQPEWQDRARRRVAPYLHQVNAAPAIEPELQIVDRVLAGDVDYLTTATISEGTPPAAGDADSTARIVTIPTGPDELAFDVESRTPGYLVIGTSFHPGWSATVNGERAPVTRADWLGMGISVPSGRSQIRLSFRTEGVRQGLLVSIASLLFWCVAAGFAATSRPAREGG